MLETVSENNAEGRELPGAEPISHVQSKSEAEAGAERGGRGRRGTGGRDLLCARNDQCLGHMSHEDEDVPSTAAITTRNIAVSVAVVTLGHTGVSEGNATWGLDGMIRGTADVLDVYFSFLLIRLLRQPCETFLEVLPSGFCITGLAIVVLQHRSLCDQPHTGC